MGTVVEITGDGAGGSVSINGGGNGLTVGRAGMRVHAFQDGPVKVELGELPDGDYGVALINPAGELTKLSDVVFGPETAYDTEAGVRNADGWGDLTGPDAAVGPSVTVTIGETGRCILILGCEVTWDISQTSAATFGGRMSAELSGANALFPSGEWSCGYADSWSLGGGATMARIGSIRCSSAHFFTGLTPGPTTFTCKYIRAFGSPSFADFVDRTIMVLPY